MPNTISAIRREREIRRRTQINRRNLVRARTLEKKTRSLVADNAIDDAKKTLNEAFSALDKAAKKGAINTAAANRRKSRLASAVWGAKS